MEEHFLKGRPVKKLFTRSRLRPKPCRTINDIPFYAKQKFIVLRNRGVIDPEKHRRIHRPGRLPGAGKALLEMTPSRSSRRSRNPASGAGAGPVFRRA